MRPQVWQCVLKHPQLVGRPLPTSSLDLSSLAEVQPILETYRERRITDSYLLSIIHQVL